MRLTRILLAGALSCAAAACTPNRPADIDPTAQQALEQMGTTLQLAKTMRFNLEATMDEVLPSGQLSQCCRRSQITLVRPGKLRVETEGDDVNRSAWYDDRKLTVLDKTQNRYAVITVPATIEGMIDDVIERYGLTMPMADLLFRRPHDVLLANVNTGTYVDLHEVNGHLCHHLAFEQDLIDWQIWIDAGGPAVPRKLLIIYKREDGQPQYEATLSHWDLSPALEEDLFIFRAPPEASRVDITQLLGLETGG